MRLATDGTGAPRTSSSPGAGGRRSVGVLSLLVCVCVSGGLLAAPARAAEDESARTAAKAKLAIGARLLDQGEYAEALSAFEQAYHLVPSAKIFFNIGLADVGLARYPEALRAFERFIGEAKNASADNLAEARLQIESLRPKVALVEVVTKEAGLEIVIDGRSYGRTPLAEIIYLDPGEHRLLAQGANGPPQVQTFTVAGGRRQRLAVQVADPLVPGSRPSPPDGHEQRLQGTLLWGTAGAAAVALGVGLFELVRANGRNADLDRLGCRIEGNNAIGVDGCASTASARDDARLGAIIALSAAGAFAATSAILFLVRPRSNGEGRGEARNATRTALACAPWLSTIGASCEGRF